MLFKDFLQWIRSTGERYIVLGHDGDPEFVIEPFAKKQPKLRLDTEMVNDVIADTAGKEHEEITNWDTMAHTLQHPVEPAVPSETKTEEQTHDEPRFQFETIDE